MLQSTHWLQWDASHLPQNCPFPFDDLHPSQLTPLTTPNGIQIQSTILPQYTLQTDRQTYRPTDGLGDRPVPKPAYALCIDYSNVDNNNINFCS